MRHIFVCAWAYQTEEGNKLGLVCLNRSFVVRACGLIESLECRDAKIKKNLRFEKLNEKSMWPRFFTLCVSQKSGCRCKKVSVSERCHNRPILVVLKRREKLDSTSKEAPVVCPQCLSISTSFPFHFKRSVPNNHCVVLVEHLQEGTFFLKIYWIKKASCFF